MKKIIFVISMIALCLSVSVYLFFKFNVSLRGLKPIFVQPAQNIADILEGKNDSEKPMMEFPLQLPDGFEISIFARDVIDARVMAFDPFGNMWVSQPKEGIISLLVRENGKVIGRKTMLKNLNNPHGLVFDYKDPYVLYFAEEDKISKVRTYAGSPVEKIMDLNGGGRHVTRTLKFGPDDRLYVSIGSSCDVCREENPQRAKIFSMNRDGSDFKEYAKGLRNAVFFTWSEVDGRMFATEMGRDSLGDNIPPDEINIIEKGKNYGWPICYGQNIHDDKFDKNTYIRNPCMLPFEEPSYVDLPAHVAPLGLAFVPEEGWPEEYWYNLLVAYHGSWNRSTPVGYKIARIKLNAKGEFLGEEDFITGWLTKDNTALGRPVDIITQPGGIMYISDDKAGVIYKMVYTGKRSEKLSNSFRDCVAAGNPVMESYPRQCRMDGENYVEDIGNSLEKTDLIRVTNIQPNQKITSPVKITGEARGVWFFEASFPITVFDDNGEVLGQGIATAKDDWMTENFVPFEANITFTAPKTDIGRLVLRKDNPSGLSEHDDALFIPVVFK